MTSLTGRALLVLAVIAALAIAQHWLRGKDQP